MSDFNTPPEKKGRGCWFWGCGTLVVLFLIACLVGFLMFQWAKSQVNAFTDTHPVQLPTVQITDTEWAALEQRAKAFKEAVQQGKPTEALVLTERDINALLVRAGNAKDLAGKVYVTVTNDQIKGQVSVPLPEMPMVGKGRYLNGEATFKVTLENSILDVRVKDMQVKGKPLPEVFMKEFRNKNLAEDATREPENAKEISKLESIKVEGDHVIIKAKSATQTEPAAPPK